MSLKECKNNISSEGSSLVLTIHSCPGLRLRIAENKLQKSRPTSQPREGRLPAWLSREDANHGASASSPPAPLLLRAVPGQKGSVAAPVLCRQDVCSPTAPGSDVCHLIQGHRPLSVMKPRHLRPVATGILFTRQMDTGSKHKVNVANRSPIHCKQVQLKGQKTRVPDVLNTASATT